ncbi:MAG: TROVE domain-containing protein, partial [Desulfobacterales bacterium]|nr:TROVE domain-containing protein [Desulfobacterales bacterium]
MARLNIFNRKIKTHEGADAKNITYELKLRRSVMSCLLWENQFYEDGISIADRISEIIPKVSPEQVASIAVEARSKMKLRHIPLLIAREMARYTGYKEKVGKLLNDLIMRPDEIYEFLSIYW